MNVAIRENFPKIRNYLKLYEILNSNFYNFDNFCSICNILFWDLHTFLSFILFLDNLGKNRTFCCDIGDNFYEGFVLFLTPEIKIDVLTYLTLDFNYVNIRQSKTKWNIIYSTYQFLVYRIIMPLKLDFCCCFSFRWFSRTSFVHRESYLIRLALIIEIRPSLLYWNVTRRFQENAIEPDFYKGVDQKSTQRRHVP